MTNLIQIASQAIDDLLAQGNYGGAINQIYIGVVGEYIYYGLLFLGLFGSLYLRRQSIIPIVILGIIIFSAIRPIIPTPIMGLALAIMGIGVGTIFYLLFVREK